MPTFNDARVRPLNAHKPDLGGDYVLYWMQAYRRLSHNHSLDHAIHWSNQLQKPLVVYEGLGMKYAWASVRTHTFMLEGMRDTAAAAKKLGINYWNFVETPDKPARGLLKKLAKKACVVVTDDYPAFVVPMQSAGLAGSIDRLMLTVDGNSVVPLKLLGAAVSAAAHLRPRLHKLFPEAWPHQAGEKPEFDAVAKTAVVCPFDCWDTKADIPAFVATLPIDQTVPAAVETGGTVAGRDMLATFIQTKLKNYGEGRNQPDDPDRCPQSRLSAYLRHGHLSIQEVVAAALTSLGTWTLQSINPKLKNKRDGYYHPDGNISSFLDEAITWRDVGYHWWYQRNLAGTAFTPVADWPHPQFCDLASSIPAWAMASLTKHATDPRPIQYTLEQLEAGQTHDAVWNASMRQMVATGRMHNYLRMLWGKKVLEWTPDPETAYRFLEHLNNKYFTDGRDPNSYTGILWCFGLFDRPWPPERKIFGSIRYMSSDNTAKKYKLKDYYEYVRSLPPIEKARKGETSRRSSGSLFHKSK